MDQDATARPSAARRWLQRLVLALISLYVLVCVCCTLYQRRLIYTPRHRAATEVDQQAKAAGLERWTNAAGQAIGMKRLSLRQPAVGQVLVLYGNGDWSVGCAHYADELQSLAPLDVYVLEYPGYADRAGTPTERHFFQAADEAMQLLGTNQPVYLLGESLGSGVASYLAGTYPERITGVILLSPYDRLTSIAQHRMPFLPVCLLLVDRFPSADYLQNYHGPVGILVDGQDTVVPEKFGLRLYDDYAGPKRLWQFPDAGHITIAEPHAKFWGDVMDFWHTH